MRSSPAAALLLISFGPRSVLLLLLFTLWNVCCSTQRGKLGHDADTDVAFLSIPYAALFTSLAWQLTGSCSNTSRTRLSGNSVSCRPDAHGARAANMFVSSYTTRSVLRSTCRGRIAPDPAGNANGSIFSVCRGPAPVACTLKSCYVCSD
jgi:hypothetical protein